MGWLLFIVVQLIAFVCTVVGWVILLPMAALGMWVTRQSYEYPKVVTAWRGGALTFLWGNEEDGVTGADFYLPHAPSRLRAYLWSAWRNSANNLRFVFRWRSGPFYRWQNGAKTLYFQMGWNASGFPVLSAGRI